ncbi:MAG: 2-isopropylmalate synthase [Chlorobium sp.]|uniref:2-isopropylmalate synthase n=1 Tax=Chlorobium sp. TaxID=1095 RepID=UPI0025BF6808|nr:2-isopropylmalate synthase [Chlorobium sp.]MCF8216679.1 2-isopropylmalate synthase [Chlorobium sp.]MCF8270860.1 2-isopropylmalate synthase [Chlorobium sp.]MCF8287206.1 2-isopropylmalate synthase [Chlorobium sp.]MCF8290863.1 2-isopropylmalate synthase [Chlorobium sp.]MCF8385620.1 2-isopropylmalate synthase [Chlorobium sp.]
MKKKGMNYRKYTAYPTVDIAGRTWPDKTITKAPMWCSVDLRDGNQALPVPMSVDEKVSMFQLLVSIGFKEIEVGFPSASATEFAFVRRLIEQKLIPEDVTIQVLTQAREHLIRKTFDAVHGADRVIVHIYNSTSRQQRDVVFRKNKEEIKSIAIEGTRLVRRLKDESGNAGIRFEYSPESFTGTELDYALDVCHAVMDAWGANAEDKVILNLPSTVEMSRPNIYADRIEWFCRNINDRQAALISVHAHNDRGTAVATAELAVMAGADRVEGALFGNGERCGNMDIVTMALNLFSQGVDPELDFSDLPRIREVYRKCTRMDVHARHPYAGELVYTAFSGSHQDAISKGLKAHQGSDDGKWDVPYLPIDPQDVGCNYEAIVRINSQSGKGGVAYVLEQDYGIHIPKWMQPDFAEVVQAEADRTGEELSPERIHDLFHHEYVKLTEPFILKKCHISWDDEDLERNDEEATIITCTVQMKDQEFHVDAKGNGPVDAFVKGFVEVSALDFSIENYAEHAIGSSAGALAVAYIRIGCTDGRISYGAGIDSNISLASIKAIVSALNRLP